MRDPAAHGGPPSYHATIFEGGQFLDATIQFQRFRKRLFVDELGWTLPVQGDVERDEFDTPNAVYGLLYCGEELVGGWRAIRTTEDYLGQKMFPQLATLRPYPSRPDIWEISRLGVLAREDRLFASRCTYALMVYFAQSRGADALIGVVEVAHGRTIGVAGIRLRRRGAPLIVAHDVKKRPIAAYLAELRPADQRGPRFARLMSYLDNLEIRDEALVLRPERVPA